MAKMTRRDYATMYGPTTGDAVRLGDTSLLFLPREYAVRFVAVPGPHT